MTTGPPTAIPPPGASAAAPLASPSTAPLIMPMYEMQKPVELIMQEIVQLGMELLFRTIF